MNAIPLLQYFDRISEAPDAVPRLRRFILDLAMRGKLVDQDPSDESAVELLKRIAAKKEILVGEGDIKHQSPLPKIESADVRISLPMGWVVARLGELAMKITDGTHKTPTYLESGVPFVSVKDFSSGRLDLSNTRFISESEHRVLYQRCNPRRGDILIGRIGTLGKAVVVDTDQEFSLFVSVGLIRTDAETMVSDFLKIQVNSPFIEAQFDEVKVGGGTHTNKLNLGDLHLIQVVLPPLAEQHRIVARVSEWMALCDELEEAQGEREVCRARLVAAVLRGLREDGLSQETSRVSALHESTQFYLKNLPLLTTRPDHIQQLRETILDLAVQGKLVAQNPQDEPALTLLRELCEAKQRLQQEESLRSRKPITRTKRSELAYSIPDSWELPSFDDVFLIASGVTLGRDLRGRKTRTVPYLRVANVQRGYLDLNLVKTIEILEEEVLLYQLRQGDILMTEGGDWDKLGRAAIWMDHVPECVHQNHVFRVRPSLLDKLSPKWVVNYANSMLGRQYFQTAAKKTTNLASINMTQLRGCPLPLPPLAEQERIVAKVDELMALCDELETRLAEKATHQSQLLEAALHEAIAN